MRHNRLVRGASAPCRPINRSADNTLMHPRAIQKHKEQSAFQSLPQHPDASHRLVHAAPIRTNLNKLSMVDLSLLLIFRLCEHTSASKHGESNVFAFSCYLKYGGSKFLFVLLITVTQPLLQAVLPSSPAMFSCYLQTAFPGSELVLCVSKDKEPVWN